MTFTFDKIWFRYEWMYYQKLLLLVLHLSQFFKTKLWWFYYLVDMTAESQSSSNKNSVMNIFSNNGLWAVKKTWFWNLTVSTFVRWILYTNQLTTWKHTEQPRAEECPKALQHWTYKRQATKKASLEHWHTERYQLDTPTFLIKRHRYNNSKVKSQ